LHTVQINLSVINTYDQVCGEQDTLIRGLKSPLMSPTNMAQTTGSNMTINIMNA